MIENIKVLKFDNATESNMLIKINNMYYIEVVFYEDNEKSLISYNTDSNEINEIITVDLRFSFFADEYSNKIYCHYIYNDVLSIFDLLDNKLVKITEKSLDESWSCIDIVGLGDFILIKEYIENEDLNESTNCYTYSLEERKYCEVNEKAIINSIESNNVKEMLIDKFKCMLTELKVNIGERYIIDVLQERYIVFDSTIYEENDIQYKGRSIYDVKDKKWYEYDGDFIVVNKMLI